VQQTIQLTHLARDSGAAPRPATAVEHQVVRPLTIALVSMPFMSMYRPSLQLGLLNAIASGRGHTVTNFHLNLDFACLVGVELYEDLSEHRGLQMGDWLFSLAAFGSSAPDPNARLLSDFDQPHGREKTGSADEVNDVLLRIRDVIVPEYLDALMKQVSWGSFDVVGFTSTFQQNGASFALAKRIKQAYPHVITLFGGANFDGDMGREWVRSVDFIDYAISGEADTAFPAFLDAIGATRDPLEIPGVVGRRHDMVCANPPSPPNMQLDALPVPNYDDYFERAEALELLPKAAARAVTIPFEGSRGCWWGAKHHCTFCGLNGATMSYRSKSPDRLLTELTVLARRYHSLQFEAVDNILDPSYLKTLLPGLAQLSCDFDIFYEVKANLTRDQVRLLRQAGVNRIQPGIESLNSHVLALMRKGIKAIQNVNLLKWCRYYGISVGWNLLWGFPGETAQDYADQARLIVSLTHLPPPNGCGPIRLERFSPNFIDQELFPTRYVRPERSYSYVYPESVNLGEAAYFFEYGLQDPLEAKEYEQTAGLVSAWKKSWKSNDMPSLTSRQAPGMLIIEDRRGSQVYTYRFEDPWASVYEACGDRPRTASSVMMALRDRGSVVTPEDVDNAFGEFCRWRLMMADGNQFLSLALPATPYR
jgi:ribosomal peptide maturation radical SAM protein 1